MNRTYLCIDLKSFYASVECMELGLDPLTTNLVVADESRTEKTICLAVEKPKFMHKYGYYEICCKLPKIRAGTRHSGCRHREAESELNPPAAAAGGFNVI